MKKLVLRFEIWFKFQFHSTWVSYIFSLTLLVFLLQNEFFIVFLEGNTELILTFWELNCFAFSFLDPTGAFKVALCK